MAQPSSTSKFLKKSGTSLISKPVKASTMEQTTKKPQMSLQQVPKALFVSRKLTKAEKKAQEDNIWKDVVRHEKLLIKLWNWKWDFLLSSTSPPSSLQLENTSRFPEIFIDKAIATRRSYKIVDDISKKEFKTAKHKQVCTDQGKEKIVNGESSKSRGIEHDQAMIEKVTQSCILPLTSAGEIGWRLSKKQDQMKYSFDLPPTHLDRVPRIRFAEEQYGVYRRLKYLKQVKDHERKETTKKIQQTTSKSNFVEEASSSFIFPSRKIRHIVNPLLC